jgi:hypothetical protein
MRSRLIVVFMVVAVLVALVAGCGESTSNTSASSSKGTTSTVPHVDKTKFATAWRSLTEIESALSVGVSYVNFGPMVQGYVTELSLLPSNLSADEAAVKTKLAEIASAYADSLTLWKAKIDTTKGPEMRAYDNITEWIAGVKAMIPKYGIPTEQNEFGAVYISTHSMMLAWEWAADKKAELAPILAP